MTTKPIVTCCLTLVLALVVGHIGRTQQPSPTGERDELQFRTWTDASGQYQTEAAMIKFADGKVHLQKKDGRAAAVSVGRLSTADQRYVREELVRRKAREEERASSSRSAATRATDWPGFLGLHRDGLSPDTGLLTSWPASGPPLLWEVNNLGGGWSSVAIAGSCLYTTGNAGDKQMLICLDLNCHPGNYVVADGFIYGKGRRGLSCVDLKSGETKWQERVGAGQLCWADGMLYAFADSDGRVTLVAPGAEGANAAGTFKVAGQGISWAHPVVIGGRLYVRYDTNLYCYNVRAQ